MSYAALARYYDLENANFTEDLGYWLDLADEHGDPILELGCGTGRVLLNLARRGHAVTGIDSSPDMLARLQASLGAATGQHLAQPPQIVQAAFEEFELAQRFNLALMPFNTFMHLLTTEAQLSFLARVRRHLAPEGVLALDLPNPAEAGAASEQGLTLERSFADGDRTVQQFASIAIDHASQLSHVTWIYDSVGPDGAIQRSIVPLTLRLTYPAEMSLLLSRSGFSSVRLYGNYDRSPFADGAPRMLVLAAAEP
jgi:SAM-dependent methyltransferase